MPESFRLRKALPADIPALHELIALSVRALHALDYSASQIDGALGSVYGVDTQLIADGTYFVVETRDGTLAGCGGWSYRQTLFGSDHGTVRQPALLNPEVDAARIRAFFVHPSHARRGIGSQILAACESAALAQGFHRFELGATIPGESLYRARGYTVLEHIAIPLPNGASLPVIRMEKRTGLIFRLRRHRYRFEAVTPLYFPPYKAENILRGMAGLLLPKAYPQAAEAILHPTWPNAPSGYATPPKPFAIRAHHLDGQRFRPGQSLHFDVVQFALALPIGEAFAAAAELLRTEGLGPGRGKLILRETSTESSAHSLLPTREATRATLNFLTPTQLDPAFNTLIARLHDRINALSTCYAGHPPLPPLTPVEVRIESNHTIQVTRHRQSTRTGQTYETGGILGPIEYTGPLTQALPYLELGHHTGLANGTYQLK